MQKNYATSNVSGSSSVSGTSSNYSTAPKGASSGKVSNNLINLMKEKEGCKLTAYQDTGGVWTIGYGHTSGVKEGQVISQEQAEAYLKQDLASFEKEVSDYASAMKLDLTQGQYDALVDFAYNCGGPRLKESGILEKLKSKDIDGAANIMKQYVRDSAGNTLQGLVTRRNIEAQWLYA